MDRKAMQDTMTMNETAAQAAAAKLDEAVRATQEAARILQTEGHPDDAPSRHLQEVLRLTGLLYSTKLAIDPPQSARFNNASDNDTLDE